MKLISVDTNAKTVKGQKQGFMTGIMYLAPFKEAGRGNVCPMASKGCADACLFTAGRGRFDNVRNARINRTHFYFDKNAEFFAQLVKEIKAFLRKAKKNDMIPCVRLNGTSDLQWEHKKFMHEGERKNIFQVFPELQFYDYTKIAKRVFNDELPENYDLTFSRSEENDETVSDVIRQTDVNIAVVFKGDLPKTYKGREVIDADGSDLRFLDEKGVICGLKAKGEAKTDESGFVIEYDETKISMPAIEV